MTASEMKTNPFLHGVCMLHECIYGVCTLAAREENPNPNLNSHDHCLLNKWNCRTCAVRIVISATRQKLCRRVPTMDADDSFRIRNEN